MPLEPPMMRMRLPASLEGAMVVVDVVDGGWIGMISIRSGFHGKN